MKPSTASVTPAQPPHVPPAKNRRSYRRLAFLAVLIVGLVVLLYELPSETRTGLLVALRRQRFLIGSLMVFTLLALSLLWSAGQTLDVRLFKWINLRARPRWMDALMNLATQVGNVVTALALSNLFFYLENRRLAIEILLGTITLWMVVEILKLATDRSRPYIALEGTRVVGWRERGHSFPSGHTSQTFFLMTLLAISLKLTVGPSLALYGVGILVGFTRIYMGVHYPRDVLGGALMGSAWGVLYSILEPYLFGQ